MRIQISSAAHEDSEKPKVAKHLIQVISDNFDCDVSTPNGLKQTHALATIVCTKDENTLENTEKPRLKQSALHKGIRQDCGNKGTEIPIKTCTSSVSSLD